LGRGKKKKTKRNEERSKGSKKQNWEMRPGSKRGKRVEVG